MNRSKPLILVVDDETHILHVVSLKLANAGYEVITAEDGEEALATALEQRPDLIITDYQMPFMSGLDLCLRLKQEPATADTPAIMLTARGFSLSAEYLERTNITAVLSKPFSPREILVKVQELVDGNEGSGVQGSGNREQGSDPRSPISDPRSPDPVPLPSEVSWPQR